VSLWGLTGGLLNRISRSAQGRGAFTICGNAKADMAALNAKAGPKPLRCAEQVTGSASYSQAHAYGQPGDGSAYGMSTTTDIRGNCCDYACPQPLAPGAR
jgi:hypothetical protein